jgi:hypothetical protein
VRLVIVKSLGYMFYFLDLTKKLIN